MKKLTVLAALILTVSAGTTAFAQTDYDPTNESVKNTDQINYKTVLITKGDEEEKPTADNIVYMAQAADTFGAATDFLLKYNSADGTSVADGVYTIRLGGGSNGTTTTAQFAVGVGIEDYDTKLETKGDPVVSNGKYSYGFVTPVGGVDFSNGGIIFVKVGDSVMAYPSNNGLTLTGKVNAMFGVQIDEVDAGQTIEVYFRPGASVSTATN